LSASRRTDQINRNLSVLGRCLKNAVIGSNRQKGFVVQHGVVSRLIQIISCDSSPANVKVEATIILGSIAKGTDEHVRALVEMSIMPILVKGTDLNH
jgi:armadillo repeat-containing protein 8